VDEIKLFKELQPPPPHDVSRMRHGARARLTAAFSAPLAHPARRRGTVVAVAGAAALVAAGTGYSLAQGASPRGTAAARGDAGANSSSRPHAQPAIAAGLTAVHGCPGMYITAGTLEQVNGAELIVQPANDQDHVNRVWQAKPVTVATTASTAITRPASGMLSDIIDGSHVQVQGTWSGQKLAATEVGIEAALPAPPVPKFPANGHVRSHVLKGSLGPPFATGTVADAHDGGFTVILRNPIGFPGARTQVQVITSGATEVVGRVGASASQLDLGSNVVAVGPIGANGVMAASTVAESSIINTLLAGGPVELKPSSCSASAITTAAIEADAIG
jgi:hypothetical protein